MKDSIRKIRGSRRKRRWNWRDGGEKRMSEAIVGAVDDYTEDLRRPDRPFDEIDVPSPKGDDHDRYSRRMARAPRRIL